MKLTYRGVQYDSTQGAIDDRFDQRREPFTLKYRGTSYQLSPRTVAEADAIPTYHLLTYRGHDYWVQRPMRPANARPVPVRSSRDRISEVERQHQANLLRNLERRIEVARQKNDAALLDALEQERRQIKF